MVPCVLLLSALLLSQVTVDFPLSRAADGTYLAPAWFAVLLLCAFPIRWFISAPLIKFATSSWPSVWVRESSFSWRVTQSVVTKLASAIVGGIAAYLLVKAGMAKE